MKVEAGNILKLFLNFSNFEPQYSYRLYSFKKKECILLPTWGSIVYHPLLEDARVWPSVLDFSSNQMTRAILLILKCKDVNLKYC